MRNNLSKIARNFTILFILIIGGIGVQTFTSCSSDDGGGEEVIATIYQTSITYDANGGVSSTSSNIEYKYNGSKNDKTLYLNGSMQFRQECKHYSNGNCTKSVIYDGKGNMTNEYEYDSKGNVTKQVLYSADGNVSIRAEYEYDSSGNTTEQVSYDANGNVTSRYEYEYDSKGNTTEVVYYNANGNVSIGSTDWNCNSDGSFCNFLIISVSNGDVSYTGEARFTTINSKRLTVSSVTTYPDGRSSKAEYEYDSRGNTTKYIAYSRQSDTDSYRKTSETTTTYTYTRI